MADEMREVTRTAKPFPIAGRYVNERERMTGMTESERAWRAQWLKDQVLSHREPVRVPELERELMNPIRRLYRAPLDMVESMMKPIVVSSSKCFYQLYLMM
jgi:NADH dehydrogenase (ubiquinone) 1 beta subcomplex subunit 6